MVNSEPKPEEVRIPDISPQEQHGVYENRKWRIINCITQYPGHTEKWYADVMTINHICARKTTLEIIKDLVSGGSITDNKIGNSFHSYSLNHDDDYIAFNEMLKEFKSIQEEFLSYYDEVWNVFYDDIAPIQKLGSEILRVYDDQLYSQLTLLKVLAVDVVGVLLKIYREMMHKYDHIGDEGIIFEILNIVDRMTGYDKKQCLEWVDSDLGILKKRVEFDSVEQYLHEKGLSCERSITRMIKFECDLNDKFSDESSEDSTDVSKRSDQNFIDDYLDLNRARPQV